MRQVAVEYMVNPANSVVPVSPGVYVKLLDIQAMLARAERDAIDEEEALRSFRLALRGLENPSA